VFGERRLRALLARGRSIDPRHSGREKIVSYVFVDPGPSKAVGPQEAVLRMGPRNIALVKQAASDIGAAGPARRSDCDTP